MGKEAAFNCKAPGLNPQPVWYHWGTCITRVSDTFIYKNDRSGCRIFKRPVSKPWRTEPFLLKKRYWVNRLVRHIYNIHTPTECIAWRRGVTFMRSYRHGRDFLPTGFRKAFTWPNLYRTQINVTPKWLRSDLANQDTTFNLNNQYPPNKLLKEVTYPRSVLLTSDSRSC